MMIKEHLEKELSKQINKEITLTYPPNIKLGHFCLPNYQIKVTIQDVKLPEYVEKTEVRGQYINIFIKSEYYAKTILQAANQQDFGSNNTGKGKHLLIEHTSINPNAPPHLGRARNALIGDAITRLYKKEGYTTEVHYYVNDIGKQIAMLVDASNGKHVKFNELLGMYIEYNKNLTKEKEEKLFTLLKKLEEGDKEVKKQFDQVVETCIKGQTEILAKLNIFYDKFDKESVYLFNKQTEKIIRNLQKKGVIATENGQKIINLEKYDLPSKSPVIPLTRKDGTSLYMLRDIAYTIDKNIWAKGKNIILLGEDHKLYFAQLEAILQELDQKAPQPIFYSFVLLKAGKMSTRKGNVVLLDTFLSEAQKKAEEEIKKRNFLQEDISKTAQIIANTAIKIAILKVQAEKNVIFTMEEALSFEGDTGSYIQYTHARLQSIGEKAGKKENKINYAILTHEKEQELLHTISLFPEKVLHAITMEKSHIIPNYLLQLAKRCNEFYTACPILAEEEQVKNARLALIQAAKQTIRQSLNLIGCEALEKM